MAILTQNGAVGAVGGEKGEEVIASVLHGVKDLKIVCRTRSQTMITCDLFLYNRSIAISHHQNQQIRNTKKIGGNASQLNERCGRQPEPNR